MFRIPIRVALVCLLFGSAGAAAEKKDSEKFKETYEAFAVAMGTSNPPVLPAGRSNVLQINITRWTTDEERAELLQTLVDGGQEALIKAMRKQEETGWVRATRQPARNPFPSTRLYYAREFVNDDGSRRIVAAADRYVSFAEATRNPRWRDYDMSLLVLDVDAEGNGEGQLAMAVQVAVDEENNRLVIENFGTEPVRLTKVTRKH